jgi:hypothetical protein
MKQYYVKTSEDKRIPIKVVDGHVYTTSGDRLNEDSGSFYAELSASGMPRLKVAVIVNQNGRILGEQG